MNKFRMGWIIIIAILCGLVYFYSNPADTYFYDYTLRISEAFLRGDLGLTQEPPSWVGEMVPLNGMYYSVFPLGAVLSILPVALLRSFDVVGSFPAPQINFVIAALSFLFLFAISSLGGFDFKKRTVMALFPLFGTWFWTNLAFGGAWQMALGFAFLGELGAIYFTVIKKNPLAAGAFFALAFGNRTELILLAPIFLYLLYDREREISQRIFTLATFLIFPVFLLGITAVYNFLRFSSPFDFGYARLPGILSESWYRHGIFSYHAIPYNIHQMLIEGWKYTPNFPYYIPTGFGGSVLLSSPFLFLLFRQNLVRPNLTILSWIAMGLITMTLWIHGNPGGWQYSYRYGITLIPWMFLVIICNSPKKMKLQETFLFILSVAINAFATYLFHWTHYVKP